MARRGMRPIVLSEREELLPEAAPIFRAYFDIDRDGFSGRPQFAGMVAVLDEMGITDKTERQRWRGFWRSMHAVETEVQEKRREQKEEAEKERQALGALPSKPRTKRIRGK